MKKFLYLAILFFAVSCTDYLSKPMFDRINAEEFFSNGQTDLELYANGLLNSYVSSNTTIGIGDDAFTDLLATKTSKDFFRPGVWGPNVASGWSNSDWRGIRRANYMIENMVRAQDSVTEEVYNHYMGVARFWRAWNYFIKVFNFGDVPWIDHVLGSTEDDILYASQDDREYVMSKVLEDLNFAAENCSSSTEFVNDSRTIINKWVALAFKARVCLFEGTLRKYHSVNPSTGVAWNNQYETANDFLEEAADAAKTLMDEGPFGLYSTGRPAEDYRALFISETPNTTEFIWCRQYSSTLPLYHDLTWYYNSTTYGQHYSPTKELVMMFLTQDGTPVDSDLFYPDDSTGPSGDYTGPEDEFIDENGELYRDYRLSQIVNPPGHTYTTTSLETANKAPDMTISKTGYAFIKWNIEDAVNFGASRDYNSLPLMRYGEVLLNYAEAMAELGLMTEDIWNQTVGALRSRAGVTSIYPESGEYVQDDFLINHYAQTEAGRNLSNLILEIRRERATELVMENGLRYKDLFRWKCGELINTRGTNGQGWKGIYVTSDMYSRGFTFNGETYTFGTDDASRVIGLSTNETDGNKTLSNGTSGYLIYNYELEWDDKMYLLPIPTSAISLNPNLYQNQGW